MLYFAELRGKLVVSQAGDKIGRLTDLVFLAEGQPFITKLVIRRARENLLIPTQQLVKINSVITVKSLSPAELTQNELYVSKNLLDQQIIDIAGDKIVRVNDVAIQDKPSLLIAGADIGVLGILRWLHIEQLINRLVTKLLNTSLTSVFLSWADIQPLELTRGKVVLKMEENKLSRIPPEDLADHLEKMNLKNINKILDILEENYEAEVIESLNPNFQQSLFKSFGPKRAAQVLRHIDPDEAVDILLALPDAKRAQTIDLLPPEKQQNIRQLLSHSDTPIGSLMTSEFITVYSDQTIKSVKQVIKNNTTDFSFLHYIYILNHKNQLVGVVNLHELLLENVDTPLYKFMIQNVVVVHVQTPVEIAIRRLLKYKIEALPVVDSERQILGIVTFNDLAEPILTKYQ